MRIDHLRLHHIRMIAMIADGAPVNVVALEMNVSGAAVSLALRRCEEMLGAPIFARKHRHIVGITPEGIGLVNRFRAILAMADGDDETVWQTAESAKPQWVHTGLRIVQRRAA